MARRMMKLNPKRKLINPILGEKVRRIVYRGTWYKRASKRPEARVSFSEKESLKKGKLTRVDRRVRKTPNWRYLNIPLDQARSSQGTYVYWCDCRCGNWVPLIAEEILERAELGLGCGEQSCQMPTVDRQIWYRPEVALQLQLMQIECMFPDRFEGLPDRAELLEAILDSAHQHKLLSNHEYWINGVAEKDCLLQDSLTLTDTPDPDLFPEGQILVNIGRWSVTLNELCEMYDRDVNRALELRLTMNDEMILEALLGD